MYEEIKKIIINHQVLPEGNNKITAVLLPLIQVNDETHILFEKRSYTLNTQPGEICLPGGKREDGELPILSAHRETMEELNLDENQIEIYGGIDPVVTPFNLIIYPFVGSLVATKIEDIKYNKDEVDHVFSVPLSYFMKNPPKKYMIKNKMIFPDDFPFDKIPNNKNYSWRDSTYSVIFYEYNGYVIWGLTAKIINNFIDIIKGLS